MFSAIAAEREIWPEGHNIIKPFFLVAAERILKGTGAGLEREAELYRRPPLRSSAFAFLKRIVIKQFDDTRMPGPRKTNTH